MTVCCNICIHMRTHSCLSKCPPVYCILLLWLFFFTVFHLFGEWIWTIFHTLHINDNTPLLLLCFFVNISCSHLLRQQALLAAISEKDANIALLELSSSKRKKAQEEVMALKREKDRLMHQLKQQVHPPHTTTMLFIYAYKRWIKVIAFLV